MKASIFLFGFLFLVFFLIFSLSALSQEHVFSNNVFSSAGNISRLCIVNGVSSSEVFIKNMSEPDMQNITVTVRNTTGYCSDNPLLMSPTPDANVTGNITFTTNSTVHYFNFTNVGNGNYSYIYNFSEYGNGTYTLWVNATKPFQINISTYKTIYVGRILVLFSLNPESTPQSTIEFTIIQNNSAEDDLINLTTELRYYYSTNNTFIERQSIPGGSNYNITIGGKIEFNPSKSFAAYSPGNYTAQVYVNYSDLGVRKSVESNKTFTVTQAGRPGGTTGGVGGVSVRAPKLPVKFTKHPILRESPQKKDNLIDIKIKNPSDKAYSIKMSIGGVPPGWITKVTEIEILYPDETKTETLSVNVPENATPGDYLVSIQTEAGGARDTTYFLMRIKQYPDDFIPPKAFRSVDVNFEENTSDVKISIQNNNIARKIVYIYDTIPKDLAQTVDDIEFGVEPTQIVKADPIVMWAIHDVDPLQEMNVEYKVKGIAGEYEPYVYWLSKNIVSISLRTEEWIRISDIYVSPMQSGSSNNFIIVNLTNVYTKNIATKIDLWTTYNWGTIPEKHEIVIPARGSESIRFNVIIPLGVEQGTYTGAIYVSFQNTSIVRDIAFPVGVGYIAGAIPFDFLYWIIIGAIVLIVSSYIISRRYVHKEVRKYKISDDRFKTLREIKNLIKGKK